MENMYEHIIFRKYRYYWENRQVFGRFFIFLGGCGRKFYKIRLIVAGVCW